MSSLVETTGLTRTYGSKSTVVRALDHVDLKIESGDFVAIMGPSGSGKSTLLNILGFLDRQTEGRYVFAGEDVSGFGHDRLAAHRNRHLGFVFQGLNLLARADAMENVALPLVYRGIPRTERRRTAEVALGSVGLGHRLHSRPQQLSGGEQQRVAIARAIVGEPLLLLADEPTGALDTATGEEILGLFRKLNNTGRTIVLITHDPGVARHAKRIVTLRDGHVVDDRRAVAGKPGTGA